MSKLTVQYIQDWIQQQPPIISLTMAATRSLLTGVEWQNNFQTLYKVPLFCLFSNGRAENLCQEYLQQQ